LGLQPLGSRSAPSQQLTADQQPLILPLIVNGDVLELFSVRSRSSDIGSTILSISGDDSPTRHSDFPAFLNGYLQCSIIDFSIGASVCVRVAGNRIILPVELARPLDVHGLTVRVNAVTCSFYVPEPVFEGNGGELCCPGCDFRFCLVQLPSAHKWIGGETQRPSQEAKCQS